MGYWRQRADEGLCIPPKGNQEHLIVGTSEFGSKSMECDTFSLQCFDTVGLLAGQQEGLSEYWFVGWWRFDWIFAHFIASVITKTIILSSNKIQNGDILFLLLTEHNK